MRAEVADNSMAVTDAHDDAYFNIQQLLDNSRPYAVQKLRVPQLEKLPDSAHCEKREPQ